MYGLDRPSISPTKLYTEIAAGRKFLSVRQTLAALEPDVLRAYNAYELASQDVTALGPISLPRGGREALSTSYAYLGRSIEAKRSELVRGAQFGRCPYCGNGRATTLDHYLPRTTFPEFSIFPLNLVPCCASCNEKKRAHFREAGCALFLHAYLDDIAYLNRFLYADISIQGHDVIPSFRVQPPSLPGDLAVRIVTHFERLDLGTAYVDEGIGEIGELRAIVEDLLIAADFDPSVVSGYLQDVARSVVDVRGQNYWRAVLLEALAADSEFCKGAWL